MENGQSILIADDNTENLRVLSNILKKEGYAIRVAVNGLQALESIRTEPPDLVLLDIQMPGMDGYEVCRRLTADEKYADIPIIFVSAMSEAFNKELAFKAGGKDYISKPFQMEEVVARVRTHMEIRSYERQLLDSNILLFEQFKGAFEQAAVGIAHLNPHTFEFIMVNKLFTLMLGYDMDELMGKTALEITDPEYLSVFKMDIKSLINGDTTTITRQQKYKAKNKEIVWGRLTASMVQSANKDINDYVVAIIQDITEQKRLEKNLHESEKTLTDFFNHGNIGAAITSVDKGWLNVNHKICEMLGYSKDELYNMTWTEMTHPEDLAPDLNLFKRLLDGEIENYEMDKRFIRKDEQVIHTHLTVSCQRNEDGSVKHILATLLDITQSKRLEEYLRQSQKLEAIGQLAGGIAHDFNNILQAIIGFTDMAMEEVAKNSRLEDFLIQISKASKRARRLVAQILSFSKQSPETKTPQNIRPIVSEVVKLLEATLPSTIEMKTSLGMDTAPVFANATQIHEVVMNLCTNAAHALNEKGILEVVYGEKELKAGLQGRLGESAPGLYSVIEVRDNGYGMSPETVDRIFEPYYTTKGQGEGTGMGMAVVFGIIQSHDGNIVVQSAPNEGAVFHVYLPKTTLEITKTKEDEFQARGGNERIMFIDDEKMLCDVSNALLSHLGYEVSVFSRSEQAFEAFKEAPETYDLIITDQTMPGMTGFELSKEMLRIRESIPILLCTGFTKNLDEDICQGAGIQGFCTKPLRMGELALKVRSMLDEAKA